MYRFADEKRMKTMTVEAAVHSIPQVTEWVDAELDTLLCPLKARMQIDIAMDEILSNIAYYAYAPETGKMTVGIEAVPEGHGVWLEFTDQGRPYNPLENATPDISLPAAERSEGGLGILLVRKTMDEVHYEYRDGTNVLSIRKNWISD